MRVLLFGDVVGKPGRTVLARRLPGLRRELGADLVIVNGENAAGGAGITRATAEELFRMGVHVITLGDHAWDKREIATYIDTEPRLLRPINFPPGTPGLGTAVVEVAGIRTAVISVLGRVFLPFHVGDPFRAVDAELERLHGRVQAVIVDFHAEATSEKQAMGWYLDGRVTAVVGTHTHVQTADACILPGGTAYITDVGMCGPSMSVLGRDRHQAIERFLTQMPVRLEVADGPVVLSGLLIEVNPSDGRAVGIQVIRELHAEPH